MKTISLRAAAVAVAFAAALPLAAFAAADRAPPPPPPGDMMGPPPGEGPMGPPGMDHHFMHMPGMMGPEMMGPHVEGRLAFVHAELKITSAQEGAWNKFADAVRANTRPPHMMMMHRGPDGRGPGGGEHPPMPPRMDLPARLEMHQKMLTEQMNRLNALKGPLLALYGVLSDEQKRGADMLMGMLIH